jgi:23S rRNA (cytosine1962-C5)-methyltransferase
MGHLNKLLDQADESRTDLVEHLASEGTDCWRLYHGVSEGRAGLTIDRFGPLVLGQTFRDPLEPDEVRGLEERFGPGFVYNHRGGKADRYKYHQPAKEALSVVTAKEFGLEYTIKPRHRGIDPHLFLDMRVARRWLLAHSQGKSVLNLFAYSCGLGQIAARAGAAEVWNVDFSSSALAVGENNLRRNGLPGDNVKFIQEDVFPIIWQISGLGIKGRPARRRFKKVAQRQFDLVLLDPPARAKGPFHTVDLVNDYQSVFKPALLACAPGGTVMATNNVASVSRDHFETVLRRCADKAERPLQSVEWLTPEVDFPSFDGQHPLKIALCGV